MGESNTAMRWKSINAKFISAQEETKRSSGFLRISFSGLSPDFKEFALEEEDTNNLSDNNPMRCRTWSIDDVSCHRLHFCKFPSIKSCPQLGLQAYGPEIFCLCFVVVDDLSVSVAGIVVVVVRQYHLLLESESKALVHTFDVQLLGSISVVHIAVHIAPGDLICIH
ncbi:hypothetical protein Tco_1320492 [Tanacetum coccineum]